MKAMLAVSALCAATSVASAQYVPSTGANPYSHYVTPHVTRHGGYVPGHYQTNPNGTQADNYGSRGNLNPYTGAYGTRYPRY